MSVVTIAVASSTDNGWVDATSDGGALSVVVPGQSVRSGLYATSPNRYEQDRALVRWFVNLPADATILSVNFIFKPTNRTTGFTSIQLVGDYYTHSGTIATSDWGATLGANAFGVVQNNFTLSADNTVALSNINSIPKNGYIGLRFQHSSETIGAISELTWTAGVNASGPRLQITYHRITAPTNLSPTAPFNRTTIQRFSWTHNDMGGQTQGAFELQHRAVGGSWTTVSQTTNNQYYDLPANTYGSSQDIEWRVRTASSDDTATLGPYSNQITVRAGGTASTPSITAPTGTITSAQPTVTWTSSGQAKYRLRIVKNTGASILDTGFVTSTATSLLPSVVLDDDSTYTYYLSIQNSDGVTSAEANSVITTNLTNPATPTINVTTSASGGYVQIAITNPTPSGGQPNLAQNQVYRKIAGENFYTRIMKGITSGATVKDYGAPSSKNVSYKVRAVGDNNAVSESTVSTVSYTLTGVWIHDVRNPASSALNLNAFEAGISDDYEAEVVLKRYLGREGDVAEWGRHKKKSIKITCEIPTSEAKWDSFAALIERRATLCLRTPRGDVYFGIISTRPRAFSHALNNDTVGIDLVGTAYTEEV